MSVLETLALPDYVRGDTRSLCNIAKWNDAQKTVETDLSGWSFILTVHSEEHPTVVVAEFALTGTISSNIVEFFPVSAAQTDLTPRTYYYDVQQTNAAGKVATILDGTILWRQDKTK